MSFERGSKRLNPRFPRYMGLEGRPGQCSQVENAQVLEARETPRIKQKGAPSASSEIWDLTEGGDHRVLFGEERTW